MTNRTELSQADRALLSAIWVVSPRELSASQRRELPALKARLRQSVQRGDLAAMTSLAYLLLRFTRGKASEIERLIRRAADDQPHFVSEKLRCRFDVRGNRRRSGLHVQMQVSALASVGILSLLVVGCVSPEAGDEARRKGWEVCAAANLLMARRLPAPQSMQDLIPPRCAAPCPFKDVPKDPWSVPLELFRSESGTLVARSCGPDRRCETADDVRYECQDGRDSRSQ